MRKLRLLITDECHRVCAGCCNNDWDLAALPVCASYEGYDQIMLTGGEPMLDPMRVYRVAREIEDSRSEAAVFLYTADTSNPLALVQLATVWLEGLTVTLHGQEDVASFLVFDEALRAARGYCSMRLNVFRGVNVGDVSRWETKRDIEWIKDCPLPKGETFMRWQGLNIPDPGRCA